MHRFEAVARAGLAILAACLIAGCGPKPAMTRPTAPGPNAYAIFLDGTANDFESETNLGKLRHRVAWQPDDKVGTFYVEGVGAGSKIIGMATGWGMGHRIRQAYRYLLRNYHEGDEIYLFGFSRGAYSARILASLLHYGGLPDEPLSEPDAAERAASRIYGAYKGEMDHAARQAAVGEAIDALGLQTFRSRKVKFMGLWDTVSALGKPDGTQDDFRIPSRLYADQLCNVERAMHAMSLDDNRAEEFTPVLLTRAYLVENCFTDESGKRRDPSDAEVAERLDRVVDEVWFPGAHSDVGGGYREGRLDGLSLNWMLPELRRLGLVGNADPVLAHPLDCVHNAQMFMGGHLYEEQPRDVRAYAEGSPYNGGRLKLHSSVVNRLWALPAASEEDRWSRGSPLGLEGTFPECFTRTDSDRHRFAPGEDCGLELWDGSAPQSASWSRESIGSRITCDALDAPRF